MTQTQTQGTMAGAILTALFATAAVIIALAFMAYPAEPDPRRECVSTLAETGVVRDGRALHVACQ